MERSESVDEAGRTWLILKPAPSDPEVRVDRLLSEHVPGVGRRLASRLCEEGNVLIDDRRARKSALVGPGSEVTVLVGAWGQALPAPEIDLVLRFENQDFVVSEKPAGVPSAALIGREGGTMAGALLARFPEMANVGFSPREPGLVHRLDTQTSGLLLAARNQSAFLALRAALERGQIEKRYLALVRPGVLGDSGEVLAPLAPHDSDPKRVVAVFGGGGHPAHTRYRTLARHSNCDLIEATASRAYRHQIRVHLADLGAPLLGDRTYGGDFTQLVSRHALHASYIAGAAEGLAAFRVESNLPADLSTLLGA